MSMTKGDPAFDRTQWIRASGAKIVVSIDGRIVDGVLVADEERGLVSRQIQFANGGIIGPHGIAANFAERIAVEFLQGKVEIKISLRD